MSFWDLNTAGDTSSSDDDDEAEAAQQHEQYGHVHHVHVPTIPDEAGEERSQAGETSEGYESGDGEGMPWEPEADAGVDAGADAAAEQNRAERDELLGPFPPTADGASSEDEVDCEEEEEEPQHQQSDRSCVISAVKRDGFMLAHAASHLQDDQEVVMAAVTQEPWALQYAGERMRDCKPVVQAAVSRDALALQYASTVLRKDREVVMDAIRSNGAFGLEFADAALHADEEIVRAAIQQNPQALRAAHPSLRAKKDVVLFAIDAQPAGSAFMYASDELKDDKEVVLRAVSRPHPDGFLAFDHVSVRLQDDPEVRKATTWPGPPNAVDRARHAARLSGGIAPLVVDAEVRQRVAAARAHRSAATVAAPRHRKKSIFERKVRMEEDDYVGGERTCPLCGSGVKANPERCHQTLCKVKHHPCEALPNGGWFSFCFHCCAPLGEYNVRVHCNNGCPHDNNPETRERYVKMRRAKRRRQAREQIKNGVEVEEVESTTAMEESDGEVAVS